MQIDSRFEEVLARKRNLVCNWYHDFDKYNQCCKNCCWTCIDEDCCLGDRNLIRERIKQIYKDFMDYEETKAVEKMVEDFQRNLREGKYGQ